MNVTDRVNLSAVISEATMQAIRDGMSVESVIATLAGQVELLQISLPVVNAVREAGRSPT